MLVIHPSQDANGSFEVVAQGEKQVDIVEVLGAAEAMSKVVAGIDGGKHFLAMGAEEAIASFVAFGRRAIGAESGNGHGHGQVVAEMVIFFPQSMLPGLLTPLAYLCSARESFRPTQPATHPHRRTRYLL